MPNTAEEYHAKEYVELLVAAEYPAAEGDPVVGAKTHAYGFLQRMAHALGNTGGTAKIQGTLIDEPEDAADWVDIVTITVGEMKKVDGIYRWLRAVTATGVEGETITVRLMQGQYIKN
jgi:hypothetical protein